MPSSQRFDDGLNEDDFDTDGIDQEGFDEDGHPLTVEAAREAVNCIRSIQGHIDENDHFQLSKTDPKWQRRYKKTAENYRHLYARYTMTVAEQLYSSPFRFIYEILQNADDAKFADGVDPTIKFRITSTKLVVELNELGFTLANVKAICHTGKSSKSHDADTTGEKGFGFKSVFGVADTVDIRSGLWSFRFEHKNGDDGIGMITPIWTDPAEGQPSHQGTHLKLAFADTSHTFAKKLAAEFEKLHKTIILALRRISRFEVHFEGVCDRTSSIAFHRQGGMDDKIIKLETTVSGNFGDHVSHIAHFMPFSKMIKDLPVDKRRSSKEKKVYIAFELDEGGAPLVPTYGQHVFAYLPVQRLAQLPFAIHADFILTANRELVPDTDRNRALRKGVASTFAHAVQSICATSHSLKFTWMRFYPVNRIDGMWEDLQAEIHDALLTVPVMISQQNMLRTITHVRYLPDWFCENNEPLLLDTWVDVYLSKTYSATDVRTLQQLGLQPLTNNMILERLRSELLIDRQRIHKRPLEDTWHTAFNRMLAQLSRDPAIKQALRLLAIIPLTGDVWVSPSSLAFTPVYFPLIPNNGDLQIQIPGGLGIQKLHPDACKFGERYNFYRTLGIRPCPREEVVTKIINVHTKRLFRLGPVSSWIADLEVLFWYGRPSGFDDFWTITSPNFEPLRAFSRNDVLLFANKLFLPSADEHDAENLLSRTPPADYGAYGFLDARYLQSRMRDRVSNGLGWESWLREIGVASFPSLAVSKEGRKILNPLLRLVARDNHRLFIENLKAHWAIYQSDAKAVAAELGGLAITCSDTKQHPVKGTVLATKAIIDKCHELGIADLVPFLELTDRYQSLELEDWKFLEQFGVICTVNSSFYMTTLQILLQNRSSSPDLIAVTSAVYKGIGEHSQIRDGPKLQEAFEKDPLIYTCSNDGSFWKRLSECVWDGPQCLSTIRVLCPIYGKDDSAATFFKTILKTRNASHVDLLRELDKMASCPSISEHEQKEKLPQLYTRLADMARLAVTRNEIRVHFEARRLIRVENRWLTPAECLWNCSIAISGKLPLDALYPKLRKFFVEYLRVTTMNASMLAEELSKLSSTSNPDIDEARRIMTAIGEILAAAPTTEISVKAWSALKASAFLPVRGPTGRQLRRIEENFWINDHSRYWSAFKGKIDFLDFSCEDLTALHPLLERLDLKSRYISLHVTSHTTIESSSYNEDLTEHLRSLSHALSCCAVAHHSKLYYNKDTFMYERLVKAEVHVCDDMWTELVLGDGHSKVTVRSTRAVVKIDILDDQIRLYVPSDKDGLYSCYCTELPGELSKALRIDGQGANKTIYRLLNDQVKDLETIMQDEDLIEYPWIPKPAQRARAVTPGMVAPDADNSQDIQICGPQTEETQTDIRSAAQSQQLVLMREIIPEGRANQTLPPRPIAQVNLRMPIEQPWRRVARDEAYRKLLREVTRQARRVTRGLSGPFSLSDMSDALSEMNANVNFDSLRMGLEGNSDFESNARIGAAGELFVFERLRALGVTNFTIENWQSTIRHNVKVHPDYRDMSPWTGDEESDIMYTGRCPNLINFLVDAAQPHTYPAFLNNGLTTDVNVHLEVKTTTGPCSARFFMSKCQYELMQSKACETTSLATPPDLFVILRVYNLLSGQIRVKAYINPWHLRSSVLKFVASSWTVTPALDH